MVDQRRKPYEPGAQLSWTWDTTLTDRKQKPHGPGTEQQRKPSEPSSLQQPKELCYSLAKNFQWNRIK